MIFAENGVCYALNLSDTTVCGASATQKNTQSNWAGCSYLLIA